METLIEMLVVLSYIIVIVIPIMVLIKIYLHTQHHNSIEKLVHAMHGYQVNYANGIGILLVVFTIALVYLIVR